MSDRGWEIFAGAIIGIMCAVGALIFVGVLEAIMALVASEPLAWLVVGPIIASAVIGAGIAYWRTRGQA